MSNEKSNKGSKILIVILLILLIGLGSYVVYDKFFAKTDNDVKKEPDSNNNDGNNGSDKLNTNKEIKLTDSEKISINKELEDLFYVPLRKITNIDAGENNVKYNHDYLKNDPNIQFDFVLKTLILSKPDLITWDINADGKEETGVLNINLSDFKNYYSKTIGSSFDESLISKEKIVIKNNKIYTTTETGWLGKPFVLKADSKFLNEKTNVYTMHIKFLTDSNDLGLDSYAGPEVLSFPKSLETAVVKIEYMKNPDNSYKISSLIIEK